jgi:hypothetical protein
MNEIDAKFFPDSITKNYPYKLSGNPVSVETYTHDMVLHFKNLFIDTSGIKYEMDSADRNIINVTLIKSISGEKRREYVFDNITLLANTLIQFKVKEFNAEEIDTAFVKSAINQYIQSGEESYKFSATNFIKLRMIKMNDVVKISSIRILRDSLVCINDMDSDGITNAEDCDLLKGERGDITTLGCIDNDLDGVRDVHDKCDFLFGNVKNEGCPLSYFTLRSQVSVSICYQNNSSGLEMPELNSLGYQLLDQTISSAGNLNGATFSSAPAYEISYSYFLSKNRRMGITAGLGYSNYSTTYAVSSPAIYTFKSNDGTNDYRRQITLQRNSEEKINYSYISVPVLFTYRYKQSILTKRDNSIPNWWVELSAGPVIMLFNNTSNYNSTISFEGLYQTDTSGFIYSDTYDPSSTWNLLFTEDAINAQAESPGAATVFHLLQQAGYDFAIDSVYTGKQNISNLGLGLKASGDICYKFNDRDRFALKLGGSFTYAMLNNAANDYKLIDKTSDEYNSIYNSQLSLSHLSYNIHAGMIFQF